MNPQMASYFQPNHPTRDHDLEKKPWLTGGIPHFKSPHMVNLLWLYSYIRFFQDDGSLYYGVSYC